MKAKKIMALLLTAAMALSMIGCGEKDAKDTAGDSATEAPVEDTATEAPTEAPADDAADATDAAATGEVSVDFEDGVFGFVGMDTSIAGNADQSVLSVEDYNGSKALKVVPQGKVPYVAFQVDAMLGDNLANLKTIEMTVGTESPDGKFYATSGNIYAFVGEDNAKLSSGWSVYLESANPKTVTYTLPDDTALVAGNYIAVSLETDNGSAEGAGQATMWIDNVVFKDASGNVLTADTSAVYVSAATGEDRSNLCNLSGAVEWEGFAVTGDGWSQNGVAFTEEVLAALVPGSVIEISYASESGNMWVVMNEAAAGWMRVGVGDADGSGQGYAYKNASANIVQVTYEQIAEYCGDDVSTWGSMMQCESDTPWEVFSVKVGQKAPQYTVANAVEFAGFACTGDAWSQNGFDMPQEIIDALVPGSVVEISYTSESGDIWIVMPAATAGWMRVGVGNADGSGSIDAVADGSKAYVTYEQLAQICGDDVSTWGATMQCESDTPWEVYGIRVGTAKEMKMVNKLVNFEGFACTGDGWSQNGFDMPQEIIDALVPGSVVTISYTSESGNMWLVMPAAAAGWMRVGVGNVDGSGSDSSAFNGSTCQVTYEQIAAVCGDDVSTWGATMQCESDTPWEVYSIAVGTAAE